MSRKYVAALVAAVVLAGVGAFGGYYVHDNFGTKNVYSGTQQLQTPDGKASTLSGSRNTAVVQAVKR